MPVWRRAALVIAASATAVLAGCGSSSKSVAAGLPLWQRVVQGGELSGYDPQIQPPQMLDLTQFVEQARPSYVRTTVPSATRELKADGFKTATIENFPSGAGGPTIASSVLLVGSASQAQRVVDWSVGDSLQPCPKTCNAQWKAVKVSGIPGAKGAHRSNLPGTKPFEGYNIAYADGPFVYDLFVVGPKPGAVQEKDLIAAVKAQYKRVKGAPLPHYLVVRGNGPPPANP
jgi:hypothetical protein